MLFKWKLCFGKWSSQWESTAGSDLEQSHADYNKEITQIRFDITKSFMQKGIPFPLLLSPECPGPQVAACPCFEQLIWHWKSTICKDNINLIKRVGCGKARIGTILKRQVPCVAREAVQMMTIELLRKRSVCFQTVVYSLRAIKYSGVNERDHSTVNVFTQGRFNEHITHCCIYMASHLGRALGKQRSTFCRWVAPPVDDVCQQALCL